MIDILLGIALAASPANAAPYFQAEPAEKLAAARLVLRDTVWKCGEAGCVAGKSNSRPAVVCAVLARQVGSLRSFRIGGEPMSSAELEKCNARAN
jgi:hypothetical protein